MPSNIVCGQRMGGIVMQYVYNITNDAEAWSQQVTSYKYF